MGFAGVVAKWKRGWLPGGLLSSVMRVAVRALFEAEGLEVACCSRYQYHTSAVRYLEVVRAAERRLQTSIASVLGSHLQ